MIDVNLMAIHHVCQFTHQPINITEINRVKEFTEFGNAVARAAYEDAAKIAEITNDSVCDKWAAYDPIDKIVAAIRAAAEGDK